MQEKMNDEIKTSITVRIHERAKEKAKTGKVYQFAAGELLYPTHQEVIKKAKEALEIPFHPYAPVAGIPELKKAASDWMNQQYHARYSNEQCIVTPGGKMALYLALKSALSNGGEVLFSSPYWVSYPEMIKLCGGKGVCIPTTEKEGWKFTIEKIKKHLTTSTKVLLINSANNPTGALYSIAEMEEIVNFAIKNNLLILSDEVYSELTYDGIKFSSFSYFTEEKDHIIVVQSLSKNFAMTGWRVGFAFSSKRWIDRLAGLQSQTTTSVSYLSQKAAIGAFENAEEISTSICNLLKKKRDCFASAFQNYFNQSLILPASSMYFFISLKDFGVEGLSSIDFCEQVLENLGIAMIPGSAFGCEGYIRIAFTETEENINTALCLLAKKIKQ